MMRRSFSTVRARVDRLAAQIGSLVGCSICQEDEARGRTCWRDVDAERSSDGDDLAALPQSSTCSACGRTYALRYTVYSWQTTENPAQEG